MFPNKAMSQGGRVGLVPCVNTFSEFTPWGSRRTKDKPVVFSVCVERS